jgi:hypothetical protein
MRPLAHHAGEQALVPLLLLLSGGGITLLVAIGRERLVAARARLTRNQGSHRRLDATRERQVTARSAEPRA